MVLIYSVDEKYFNLFLIKQQRIFQPVAQGTESVSIINMYDTRQQLLSSTHYSEFEIDGETFASQSEVIDALLDVISYSGSFESEGVKVDVTLTVAGWAGGTSQVASVAGASASDRLIFLLPETQAEIEGVRDFGIYPIPETQGDEEITFVCDSIPDVEVSYECIIKPAL